MKQYIGAKQINAMPMTRSDYNDFRNWILPDDEDGNDEGYLVEYIDGGQRNTEAYKGYVSWSPKDVFERSYREVSGLSFGLAIEAMKMGHKMARAGWNGRGMFVYYVPANSYPVQTGAAKSHFGEGSMVPYNAYMAIKNVDNTVSTWVPSVNDVLADDWSIVE
jgi:hypothetical protein